MYLEGVGFGGVRTCGGEFCGAVFRRVRFIFAALFLFQLNLDKGAHVGRSGLTALAYVRWAPLGRCCRQNLDAGSLQARF